MSKNQTKKLLLRAFSTLLAVFVLVVILTIGAQLMAKDVVSDFLERKLPQHVQLQYEDMDVNILTGTVGLGVIALDFYDRDSMLLNTSVKMDAISLEGLGYWDFLFNEKIDVRLLQLEAPDVRYYPYRLLPDEDSEPTGVVQLLKTIAIGELSVRNGRLHILQQSEDSIALRVGNVDFSVTETLTDPELITKKIPVTYGKYDLIADSLYVDLGQYEDLQAVSIHWNPGQAKVMDLRLRSKYDKNELSPHLITERDHIDFRVPEMDLDSIRFGFERDTFFLNTGKGTIKRPNLEMFRDKLVDDDDTEKELYSRSIRQLPIHIDVPEVEIVDGKVVYSERIADVENPGKLSFQKMNATLTNISNTYPEGGKTVIKAETEFMEHAEMTLDWSFDVNHVNDAFLASGSVSGFDTESVNPFLESNARVKASGQIDQLYFTVSGNSFSSAGDMQMDYQNFSFKVYKKDGSGINKLLTAVGNLFVDNGSDSDSGGYRYGGIEVERDPTKSFFNYLWLNVRDGTVSVLTGDGEKE